MKATITRPDGTRIEAEGAAEEIARLAQPQSLAWYQPTTCTCWAGICPLHTMRGTSPIPLNPWFTPTSTTAGQPTYIGDVPV